MGETPNDASADASTHDDGGDGAARPTVDAASCMGKTKPEADAVWTLTSNGTARTANVHVPRSYDSSRPVALVLDFHGQYSNATEQDALSKMSAEADASGFVAIFPEGIAGSWNAGGDCCGQALDDGVDDVRFVRDLLDEAAARLCVDPARIFATGMSAGAYLVHRLGCALSDRIAAIAPVAGVLSTPPACAPVRAVPVLEFHGTGDLLVSYDGAGTTEEPSVPDTFAAWAARDGCTGAAALAFHKGDADCRSHASCRDGAEVTLCTIDGGGHTWPGGTAVPLLGKTSTDISATHAMWTFFSAHPRH